MYQEKKINKYIYVYICKSGNDVLSTSHTENMTNQYINKKYILIFGNKRIN